MNRRSSERWTRFGLTTVRLKRVWKAIKEIHHNVDPDHGPDVFEPGMAAGAAFGAAIGQILVLDLVFSIDSITTAVGMMDDVPIMVVAVLVAVATMLLAANPLANFVRDHPTVVMLALGFLIMIGMALIAEGFGAEIPEGHIYAAMAVSAAVEGLNMLSRRARWKHAAALPAVASRDVGEPSGA